MNGRNKGIKKDDLRTFFGAPTHGYTVQNRLHRYTDFWKKEGNRNYYHLSQCMLRNLFSGTLYYLYHIRILWHSSKSRILNTQGSIVLTPLWPYLRWSLAILVVGKCGTLSRLSLGSGCSMCGYCSVSCPCPPPDSLLSLPITSAESIKL